MNTKANLRKWSWIQLDQRRAARTAMLLLLLMLILPAVVQAQFSYVTNNGTITITKYTGPGGAVTIPDAINGLPVTSIGGFAFYQCTSLTSAMIPNSVTSIGDSAFNSCGSLTTVTIPNGVTNIGASAFTDCTGLTNATIGTSVISIGSFAFEFCSSLTCVTIPDSVTSIGFDTFQDCHSLTSVTIPNGVTSLDSTFSFCYSLTNVTIGTNVTSLNGTFYHCGLTSLTIPNSVTNIGNGAFNGSGLKGVTIPDSVTSIGIFAFGYCSELRGVYFLGNAPRASGDAFEHTLATVYYSVATTGWGTTFAFRPTALWDPQAACAYTITNGTITINDYVGPGGAVTISSTIKGSPVTSIGYEAFLDCHSLTSVTIPDSVTGIGGDAFSYCTNLTGVYFNGNAPSLGGSSVFFGDNNATVYYLPGTTGWGGWFGGRPTALWPLPTIQTPPQTQTAEAGSAVDLRVKASGSSPLFCLWYLNDTNLMSCSTNQELELTNVQFAQSGAYTVVVTNGAGAITSSPAMLNVIVAVERRPAEGVLVRGEAGSVLNVDYANSLSATPNWLPLDTVTLASTSQYCLDVTQPLPPLRYYRAWQTGTPSVIPSLSLLGIAPAITLTGSIGHSVRLDYINQLGPTDAWVTLATVTLTNTSQLYFDVSAPGQPTRLYRIVPLP